MSSTTLKLQSLFTRNGHGGGGFGWIVDAGPNLAGEIGPRGIEGRVVEGLSAVRSRVGQLHVGRCGGREGRCKEDGLGERHGC